MIDATEREIQADTLLTFAEVAELFGLTPSAIHHLNRGGEFGQAARKFGTTWVVPASAVECYRRRARAADLLYSTGRRRKTPDAPICRLPGDAENTEEEPILLAAN